MSTAADWGIAPAARPLVDQILRDYPVKITSGRRSPAENRRVGGATNSDHLTGLGVDLVPDPARGGTWADVDRLARWAEPTQDKPIGIFRWVGYTGDPGHGPDKHLHLSFAADQLKDGGDLVSKLRVVGGPAAAIIGGGETILDTGKDAAAAAAEATAKALAGLLVDAIGKDGARVALYVLLVGAGASLAVVGVARATGVRGAVADVAKLAIAARTGGKAAAA